MQEAAVSTALDNRVLLLRSMHYYLAKFFIIVTKQNDQLILAESFEHDVPEPDEVLPHAVHVGGDPEPEVAREGDNDGDHVCTLRHLCHHPLSCLATCWELIMGRQSEDSIFKNIHSNTSETRRSILGSDGLMKAC